MNETRGSFKELGIFFLIIICLITLSISTASEEAREDLIPKTSGDWIVMGITIFMCILIITTVYLLGLII